MAFLSGMVLHTLCYYSTLLCFFPGVLSGEGKTCLEPRSGEGRVARGVASINYIYGRALCFCRLLTACLLTGFGGVWLN
jgi:hypothetical protein